MDYSTFYPQTTFPNLTAANLQANHAFSLNPNTNTTALTQQQPRQQQPPQQQQPSGNNISQLQQNMFYLDPFEAKVDQSQCPDLDHASFSNESDVFLDELDDMSRAANAAQSRRSLNGTTRRNPSPQGLHNISHLDQSNEFDLNDMTSQDFMDTSGGGNSTKRKAQNRAAQRAFRERKERHVKELESKVLELEQMTNKVADENGRLKHKLAKLELENSMLKGSNVTFTFPQFEKGTTTSQNGNYSPPLSDHGSFTDSLPLKHDPLVANNTMTNGVTNDITMFNLDNFMAPPTPTSAGPHPITQPIPKSHSPDSSSSNYSKPSSQAHTPNTPVSARAQNLMMQYHDYTEHQTSSNVKSVADDGHHYFDCPKVWERIVMHPRFDEVDVEALCAELNAKVRICVERGGPSVDSHDLETALDQAIDEVVARN